MSHTAGDETSRGRNPENGRRRDFGRRRHRQSGFQHTDRPRPSNPEMFNKDHNAGRESLSHLKRIITLFKTVPLELSEVFHFYRIGCNALLMRYLSTFSASRWHWTEFRIIFSKSIEIIIKIYKITHFRNKIPLNIVLYILLRCLTRLIIGMMIT